MAKRFRGPPQGWAALRWEVGVVFVGVVLALLAQQVADTLYWREQAAQAKRSIESELLEHEVDAFERLAVQPCLTRQLRALHDRLASNRGEWRGLPMATRQAIVRSATQQVVPTAYRSPSRLWSKEAWERAQATGALNHLPDRLVQIYAEIYTRSQRNKLQQDSESAAAARLSALAVDGRIDAPSRILLLAAIAQIDQDNSSIVAATTQILERLGVALRDVPDDRRKLALNERLKLQRTFRGSCVVNVPIEL